MMRLVKSHAFLLVAAVLVLLAPWSALAAPVGTFSKVEGAVDILRQNEIAATKVRAGDPVSMGDAVRTKRAGKAEITFQDETVIQLAPETRITIDEYTYRGKNARERGLISLLRGKVRAIVSKLRVAVTPVSRTDTNFNVRTPTAIAGVKGSELIVYYERGVTGVIFIEGEGFVYNPSKPGRVVNLRGGQVSFVLSADEAPQDAQPVSESFIAPHLKDMPGSALETVAPPPAGDSKQIPPPAVISMNTTYSALTDAIYGSGAGAYLLQTVTVPLIITDPVTLPASPPGGPWNLVPVTQAYPALLPTPVSLSVTIP
jgi:hypothetical protein